MRAVTIADDSERFTRGWADRDELGRIPGGENFRGCVFGTPSPLVCGRSEFGGSRRSECQPRSAAHTVGTLALVVADQFGEFAHAGPGKRQCPRWRHSGRNDDYLYAGASPDGSASEKKRRSLQRMIAGVSVLAVVALSLAITSFVRYFAGSIG
jgi:hypothetical protein